MRDDVLVEWMHQKCENLKRSGLWEKEPIMKPREWLSNFDEEDKSTAAYLLDKFVYYNDELTNKLFTASYHSLGDEYLCSSDEIINALKSACFTPVRGEDPRPTDSGYLFCRKARQIIKVSDDLIFEPDQAILHAQQDNAVVFLDDFIGSGDQFIKTWQKKHKLDNGSKLSFSDIHLVNNFKAIYIALVGTSDGIDNIQRIAPNVVVSTSHVLGNDATIKSPNIPSDRKIKINHLLKKYKDKLKPIDSYMYQDTYLEFGYKNQGLLLGFSHSIPDGTLPIFWASGENWQPLIERT